VAPDPILQEHVRSKLKHPPLEFGPRERRAVRLAIEEYCRFKQWPLQSLHVRTNHVHVVVSAVADASKMLNGLKARATRMLREAGLFDADRPIWTERGNIALLFDRNALAEAIDYVANRQGETLPEA
jgi:REP element-mobilizing transposase RayT